MEKHTQTHTHCHLTIARGTTALETVPHKKSAQPTNQSQTSGVCMGHTYIYRYVHTDKCPI